MSIKIRFFRYIILCLMGLNSALAYAQLETRGSRDAAGLREQLRDSGEESISLEDLSAAYDRASASWLEVFGKEPFERARLGALVAVSKMKDHGWTAPDSFVSIAMLDARGDAAWMEKETCRAQINIGTNGQSPVSVLMGDKAFVFLSAHELGHCLFDSQSLVDRLPRKNDLLQENFPVKLTPMMAQKILEMLKTAKSEDGSDSLFESYDESLADTIACLSLVDGSHDYDDLFDHVLQLRMGAAFLSIRIETPPPAHLGAYAIYTARATYQKKWNLAEAHTLALASVLVESLGQPYPPRWVEALGDEQSLKEARDSAMKAYNSLLKSRDSNLDEQVYLSAKDPAMFVLDLTNNSKYESLNLTPEQALAYWKSHYFIFTQP